MAGMFLKNAYPVGGGGGGGGGDMSLILLGCPLGRGSLVPL